ncbi:hypothetical protein B0H13DRAFT_2333785 [Mycena leptocephala]|nr:hypothetical protein B0H13DRAFT_2333785 [Mycena leptocephala]
MWELRNASTFLVTTIHTPAGDWQSRARTLWTVTRFRTIHGVLDGLQARLKHIQAESKSNCWACSRPSNIADAHADDHGATKVFRHSDSTTQATFHELKLNHVRTANEASLQTFWVMSFESEVPPKRLKLGPLKGLGVKNGVSMSAEEYAQKHWSEFREDHPEMLNSILPDDIQVE